jgi:argininosuccinate lyase
MARASKKGYLLATDLADYLVKKGLDFRSAHHTVGAVVAYALKKGKELKDLTLSDLKTFHPIFEKDVKTVLDLSSAMAQRNSPGGTAPKQVQKALREMEIRLCSI